MLQFALSGTWSPKFLLVVLGDHMGCWGSNSDQLHTRQVPCLLSYHSGISSLPCPSPYASPQWAAQPLEVCFPGSFHSFPNAGPTSKSSQFPSKLYLEYPIVFSSTVSPTTYTPHPNHPILYCSSKSCSLHKHDPKLLFLGINSKVGFQLLSPKGHHLPLDLDITGHTPAAFSPSLLRFTLLGPFFWIIVCMCWR